MIDDRETERATILSCALFPVTPTGRPLGVAELLDGYI